MTPAEKRQLRQFKKAIASFRWLGNNLHNSGTETFRRLYDGALEDARLAMGDDWIRVDLREERIRGRRLD